MIAKQLSLEPPAEPNDALATVVEHMVCVIKRPASAHASTLGQGRIVEWVVARLDALDTEPATLPMRNAHAKVDGEERTVAIKIARLNAVAKAPATKHEEFAIANLVLVDHRALLNLARISVQDTEPATRKLASVSAINIGWGNLVRPRAVLPVKQVQCATAWVNA